ncbi:MAG: hypothetical protein ACRDCE_22855 [Cetobacterium sp.]|uniref:hypothetical protein n=1 Tax=Cetobacterium sp. TaxID=2071632 RepID=UPI003EE5D40B
MLDYIAYQDTHLFIAKQVCEKLGFIKNNPSQNVKNAITRFCPNAKQAQEHGVKLGRKNSILLTTAEVLHLATHCQYDASELLEWLRSEGLWNGMDVSSSTRRELDVLSGVELALGRPLQRQYQVGPFLIDGYDPILNVAFEIDEVQHLSTQHQLDDELRELYITESIEGIAFRRISI